MLYDRCSNNRQDECGCAVRLCVSRVGAILAIILALVTGVVLGSYFVSTFIESIIPLIIFAVGLLLAIVLIYVFFGCRCTRRHRDE